MHMDLKELFVESIADNKKLIIGLYILFIITFIISAIFTAPHMQNVTNNITPLSSPSGNNVGPVELFIVNEWGGIFTYFASIFFGIFAVIMILYNGLNLGIMVPFFSNIMPNGGIMYLIYLIPHGIFEITGMVLQSTAGIVLFLFIWRFFKAWRSSDGEGASDAFEMTKKFLIQSVMLMLISTILILIAAPIESYVSIPFSNAVMGLLGLS